MHDYAYLYIIIYVDLISLKERNMHVTSTIYILEREFDNMISYGIFSNDIITQSISTFWKCSSKILLYISIVH